jgi:hypothetical protein
MAHVKGKRGCEGCCGLDAWEACALGRAQSILRFAEKAKTQKNTGVDGYFSYYDATPISIPRA